MTPDIYQAFAQAVDEIAPEADLGTLDSDLPFREELDLDSMDFLNLMIALHKSLGVEIPERDYPRLQTLSDALRYLETAVADLEVEA